MLASLVLHREGEVMPYDSYTAGALAMRAAAVKYAQNLHDAIEDHIKQIKLLAIPNEVKPPEESDTMSTPIEGTATKVFVQSHDENKVVPEGFVDMVVNGPAAGLAMNFNVTTPEGVALPGEWVVRHQDNQRVWRVEMPKVDVGEEREDIREQNLKEARKVLDEAVDHTQTIQRIHDLRTVLGHILDALDRPEPKAVIEVKGSIPEEQLKEFKRMWDKIVTGQSVVPPPGICIAQSIDPEGRPIVVGEWKKGDGCWEFYNQRPTVPCEHTMTQRLHKDILWCHHCGAISWDWDAEGYPKWRAPDREAAKRVKSPIDEKPIHITDQMIREGLGLKSRKKFLRGRANLVLTEIRNEEHHHVAPKDWHSWMCERGTGRSTETKIEALKALSVGKVVHIRGGTPDHTEKLNQELTNMAIRLGMKDITIMPTTPHPPMDVTKIEIFHDHTYTEGQS